MSTKCRTDVITLTLTNNSIKEAVKTYTLSKRYINTMLKATIINILYRRLNIDEQEFVSKSYKDISFKSFRPKSKNPFIREFHTYILACKDALDKNYLRDFYLFFIDRDSGDIIENYKFSFQYSRKDKEHEAQNTDDLTAATCELLRTLEELGNHSKIDKQIEIKAELTYFNETPEDYEPPGFKCADETNSLIKKINKKGNSVIIGKLFTGFHMLKCRGKGDVFNFNMTTSTAQPEFELNEIVTEDETDTAIAVVNNIFTEDLDSIHETSQPRDNEADYSKTHDSYNISNCPDVSSDEEDEINCPCKLPVHEWNISVDYIQCERCKRKYHSPCQGFLDKTFVFEAFRCNYCLGDGESIVDMFDIKKTMGFHRMRFIIGAMYKYGRVPIELKSAFGGVLEQFQRLQVFEFDENIIKKVNVSILGTLFKLEHKMLDAGKFKTI